jgi:hypothetical protein
MLKRFLQFSACAVVGGLLPHAACAGGVTIVTHGFNADMVWVNAMADAIAERAGTPGANVTRLNLVVNEVSGNLVVTMSPLAVAPEPAFTTGEFVIGLDWTAIDSFARSAGDQFLPFEPVLPDGQESVPTQNVAQAVFNFLQTWTYGGQSILAQPFHLIGHSRGGALVASLARSMGERGVWVDHLTTLDPVPVGLFGDAAARVVSSVVFADNIWQSVALPSGSSLAGAFNQQMGNLGSSNHSRIHTFYYGTIDPLATGDGECTSCINPAWYTTDIDLNSRSQSGFWYSRIGGGDRTGTQAASGLLNSFGGTAFVGTNGRLAVAVTQPAWPNVFEVETAALVVTENDPNSTAFYYQSTGSSVQVAAYASDDRNPNHGGTLLGTATLTAAASPTAASLTWSVNPAPRSQPYSIYLAITSLANGRVRYAFDAQQVTVLAEPACPADLNQDGQVDDADFVSFAIAYELLDCADPSMPANCPADLNDDGIVDDADFVIFAGAYDQLLCP